MSVRTFLYALGVGSIAQTVLAATITYDFTVGWVTRNPDNAQERPVMGINGQWPIPMISVTKGDRVIVNLHNDLGNQSTSLHFHGLYMNGTTEMDGVVGVSQCGLAPGSSMTYDFTVDQPGTYWYHSHERGQYPDGLRGPFIVHDPDNPYADQFDEQTVLTLSDWYHEQMPPLLADFISYKNPTGAEPVPDSALMGDSKDFRTTMEPGKTYFFRIINMGAFAGQYFWIEGHSMRIIEVDGVYTEPQEANMIYVTAAQRYGVLVTARNDASANFPIVGSMDTDLFDTIPPTLNYNVTGWAVYDPQKSLPEAKLVDEFDFYDDYNLIPQDREPLYQNVDRSVNITMKMGNLGDGANYAFINDVSWVAPKTPVLYSVLTSGEFATDATVYGPNTNAFILAENEVVELIFNNADPGKHPFHLHGHNFQLAYRSDDDAGNYNSTVTPESSFKKIPMRRDTVMVHPNGNFVLRFRSDNPGVWLYHCHIEWHVASGLIATFIESPLTLQSRMNGSPTRNPLPADHLAACASASPSPLPTIGNAVGNTGAAMLNLAGANTSPAPLPAGFTARGIVALVFSCISAFIGIAIIAWYGAKPISSQEQIAVAKRIKEAKIVEKKEQLRHAKHRAVVGGADDIDGIRPTVGTS